MNHKHPKVHASYMLTKAHNKHKCRLPNCRDVDNRADKLVAEFMINVNYCKFMVVEGQNSMVLQGQI